MIAMREKGGSTKSSKNTPELKQLMYMELIQIQEMYMIPTENGLATWKRT